MEEMRRKE